MSTLRKGLQDAGGIPGVPEAAKDAVIDQVLIAASVSIDMAVAVAAGKLDLRKPASWAQCIPACVGYVLNGQDMAVLQAATAQVVTLSPPQERLAMPFVEEQTRVNR